MIGKVSNLSKKDWAYVIFLLISLVVSVFPRWPFMHRLSANWRSDQTLLTSFWFQKEGISLFHPQLPVYGPFWEVPFEFPLYQAISTLFSNTTHLNLTASCRVVSLASFYVSALFLLLLCLEFLDNKALSAIIILVYLYLPYDIRYSTEILIDYLAVALALGYIFFLKKFLDSPRNLLLFAIAIIFGCLGAMVKITTMATVIIPAILLTLSRLQTWGIKIEDLTAPQQVITKIGKQKLPFLLLTIIAILPILSAGLWTKYTDSIKQSNVFTLWLTSANLTRWNFGTLDQKISFTNWWNWLTKINDYFFLEGILLLFPLLGIVFLYKMPSKSRSFFGAALTGTLLTMFIFFNLYLHEYYYIAVSAYVSILIGFGIFCLFEFLLPYKTWWIVLGGIFFIFVFMKGLEQYRIRQAEAKAEVDYVKTEIIPLANKVTAITPENKYIISVQRDWYPGFILYSKRKGLVISPKEDSKFSCELINKYDYSTIVIVDRPLNTLERLGILDCFKSVQLIRPRIYQINP